MQGLALPVGVTQAQFNIDAAIAEPATLLTAVVGLDI
jgi:hypothetical protein